MTDLENLEAIASDIDSEGWSEYADDIRGAAEEIKRLRDALQQIIDIETHYHHGFGRITYTGVIAFKALA